MVTRRDWPKPSLWMDAGKAETLTLDTGLVSAWSNFLDVTQSFTATSTDRPTYVASGINGYPSIDFDGTTFLANSSQIFTGAAGAVIIIGEITTLAAFVALSHGDTALAAKCLYLGATYFSSNARLNYYERWDNTADSLYGNTFLNTNPACWVWHNSGSVLSMWVNGVEQTVSIASGANNGHWWSVGAANKTVIGGAVYASTIEYKLDGLISEIVVYDQSVSYVDILPLINHLSTKYGIS